MLLSEETRKFILTNRDENIEKLAFGPKPSGVDIPFALTQIAGRQAIKNKIPAWYFHDDILYPPHLSLEQCSSELTASYKASLIRGSTLIDLTGGFGVDSSFFARNFEKVYYVEKQPVLCNLASHNFNSLGLKNVEIFCGDAIDFIDNSPVCDWLYIDPARRGYGGRKMVAIQDCEPDILKYKELFFTKTRNIMVKLSPMLDISSVLHAIPEISRLYILSVKNECKELVLILTKDHTDEAVLYHVNILPDGSCQTDISKRSDENKYRPTFAGEVERYLYEPNASLMKSGVFAYIAHQYGVSKIGVNSHLYTSAELKANFPGRIFRVVSVFPLNKKEIKENLADVRQANITVRNFPLSVDEIRKKLKLKDGGEVYLIATTLSDGSKVLIRGEKCG